MKPKASASRLEKSYAEALASLGDPKNICGALEETARILLGNLEARIAWKYQDATARKQRQPVSLTAEMVELERIGRIIETLQSPRLMEYRTGDPDAGGLAIVAILEQARKEFSNEQTVNKATKTPPDSMDKEEGEEPDEIKQNPTVERRSEPLHRVIGHGKVRRGSG